MGNNDYGQCISMNDSQVDVEEGEDNNEDISTHTHLSFIIQNNVEIDYSGKQYTNEDEDEDEKEEEDNYYHEYDIKTKLRATRGK